MRRDKGTDSIWRQFWTFEEYSQIPLDKDRLLWYRYCVQKTVPIRIRPETRDRLHSVKNPGQTLDGIITQLIDLWGKEKKKDPVEAAGERQPK